MSLSHSARKCISAWSSCDGSKFTMNEIDALKVNSGPALIAMKSWPFRLNVTKSQSPLGVPGTTTLLVIIAFGKTEQ